MRKTNRLPLAILFSVAALAPALLPPAISAQEDTPQEQSKPEQSKNSPSAVEDHRYYHLDFALREIGEDGKVINSRAYSIVVGSDDKHIGRPQGLIRTGSKIPVSLNGSKTVFQYQDIGVNIDSRNVRLVHLAQDELSLQVEAEISSLAPTPQDANDGSAPVIRQNKWDSEVVLPLNKPTILFSSDNVSSKGKLQLELTATPIK